MALPKKEIKQEPIAYSPATVLYNLRHSIDDPEIIKEIYACIDFTSEDSFFKTLRAFLSGYGKKISMEDTSDMMAQMDTSKDSKIDVYKKAEQSIIHTINRPAFLIRNGHIDDSVNTGWKQRIDENYDIISKTIPSVGRIEITGHPMRSLAGTGWLIKGTDIIVTNSHVATTFASRQDGMYTINEGLRNRPLGINIDFKEEHEINEELEFDIIEVLHINKKYEPDIALLKVKPTNSQGASLPEGLEISFNELVPEDTVFVVGYPGFDSSEEVMESDFDFQNIPDVKRLAPGEIFTTGAGPHIYLHDCSTWYGNSGSPVIDFCTGKVVGVHYAGSLYEYQGERANWAVKSMYLIELLDQLGLSYTS